MKQRIQTKVGMIIRDTRFPHILVLLFLCIYTIAGIAINLHRFWQFELGYYDFGIFDRALWHASHFRPPIIDHFIVPGKWIFADHFNPSIFILTPVYWLTDKSEFLLFFPSIAIGISGYIIFKIADKLIRNRYAALAIVITYMLSIGVQNAVYSDFHELTLASAFIALTYWAIISKERRLFYIALILTFGFKENLFLFGLGTSFFIFFYNKKWRKDAVIAAILSLGWAYLAIKVAIPYFSGQQYYYANLSNDYFNLAETVQNLFYPDIKPKTVFFSFANYLFVPLGYLPLIPTIVFNFVSRFLTPGSTRWDMGLHYNAEIAPAFALASAFTFQWIKSRKFLFPGLFYGLCIMMIFNSLVFHQFIFHGPMGLAYRPVFYANTKNHLFLKNLVEKIPQDATVLAQNNLASHLMHHKEIWILRDNYKVHNADYIVFDTREGQAAGNLLGIENKELLFKKIATDKEYMLYYNEGDQFIYKKIE